MKAYHGTSAASAEKIQREGFRITDSDEMYLGRGLYLAKTPQQARQYGEVVLEVNIPESVELGDEMNLAGIGTFEQFKEDVNRGMYLDDDQDPDSIDVWALYRQVAKERAEDAEADILETETQYVVYSPELARRLGLSARRLSSTRTMMRHPHTADVSVRAHLRRSKKW